MKKLWSVILVGWVMFAVSGCNTMEGIGKDLKKGGEKVEKAAKS